MSDFEFGDKVYFTEYCLKLVVVCVRDISPYKYSCVDMDGYKWNWFKDSELKPIKKCYATLGKTGV